MINRLLEEKNRLIEQLHNTTTELIKQNIAVEKANAQVENMDIKVEELVKIKREQSLTIENQKEELGWKENKLQEKEQTIKSMMSFSEKVQEMINNECKDNKLKNRINEIIETCHVYTEIEDNQGYQ